MKTEKAKQYLEKRGTICPFCDSHDVEGGSLNFEAGEVVQSISCHDCSETWTDVYKLVAVADAQSGDIIASITVPAE